MSVGDNIEAAARHIAYNIRHIIDNGIQTGRYTMGDAYNLIKSMPYNMICNGNYVQEITNIKNKIPPLNEIHKISVGFGDCSKQTFKHVQNILLDTLKRNIEPQGFRNGRRVWPQYRYGRIPPRRRPAVDYRDNYWIPPYEIPVEPDYFPGYNIVELRPRYVSYYWPIR